MNFRKLENITANIQKKFDKKDRVREDILDTSRKVIKLCAKAIKNVHRGERESAEILLKDCEMSLRKIKKIKYSSPDIYFSGYVQDAQKEYTEAKIFYSIIYNDKFIRPEKLQVEDAPYLNGLGEVIGELRRYILDNIRNNRNQSCEKYLKIMEEIYYQLFNFDYPEVITQGLRRTVDNMRVIVEKTRGDLTLASCYIAK